MGDLGQALFIRSCREDVIFTRKSHNCAGTAFVQGDSAGGSKLIEQTLPSYVMNLKNRLVSQDGGQLKKDIKSGEIFVDFSFAIFRHKHLPQKISSSTFFATDLVVTFSVSMHCTQ